VKVATVITEPSGVRIRVIVTRGGTGRGRTTGDAVARVVAVLLGCRDEGGEDTAAGELHAATASRPTSVAAILRIIGSGS
jgi:hypothetical protein